MSQTRRARTGSGDWSEWIERMYAGDRLALARTLTQVENRGPAAAQIISQIFARTGRARVIGITGPPGAGKSTLVDRLVTHIRARQQRVAVVAVDPSSPFSGGAILGDRIRMQAHHQDLGVYIRSLGTRGRHGGLSHATKEVVMVLDAAGFDTILVETTGVGQTELDVLKLAQTVLVVLVPESGDSIQVMKAGLMEIADLFAVNKSDRPEADRLVKELATMVALGAELDASHAQLASAGAMRWSVPVHKTEAVRDAGVAELVDSFDRHAEYLLQSGAGAERLRRFLRQEVGEILTESINQKVDAQWATAAGKQLLARLERRELDPYRAAQTLLDLDSSS